MKKITLTLIVSCIVLVGFSQSKNIQNAYNSYRQETDGVKTKLAEAKDFIDLAYNHESTSTDPKMWNYRSKIYLEIMLKDPALDKNAVFEATEAYCPTCGHPEPDGGERMYECVFVGEPMDLQNKFRGGKIV